MTIRYQSQVIHPRPLADFDGINECSRDERLQIVGRVFLLQRLRVRPHDEGGCQIVKGPSPDRSATSVPLGCIKPAQEDYVAQDIDETEEPATTRQRLPGPSTAVSGKRRMANLHVQGKHGQSGLGALGDGIVRGACQTSGNVVHGRNPEPQDDELESEGVVVRPPNVASAHDEAKADPQEDEVCLGVRGQSLASSGHGRTEEAKVLTTVGANTMIECR